MNGLEQRWTLAVAALLWVSVNIPGAEAQTKRPISPYAKASGPPVKRYVKNPAVYEPMREPPRDLPFMPSITPPGSKFILAMKDDGTHSNGKPKKLISLSLRYGTTENPQSLLKFYADSLKQAKWTVLTQNQNMTQATYIGNTCTVILVPKSNPNYTTDFQVNYQLVNTEK
jgi:hypothetical protein